MASTGERLTELEARVAALEARAPALPATSPRVESGTVGYQGDVRLNGQVRWRIRYAVESVLALPVPSTVEVLAAIGHPLRLAIVRRLLHGAATAAELQTELDVNSTGKLYHHLRILVAAHVVASTDQTYSVPATATVPVLALLLAAGDVAGTLRDSAPAT